MKKEENIKATLAALRQAQNDFNTSIKEFLYDVAQEKGSRELRCNIEVADPNDPNDSVNIDRVSIDGDNIVYHSCSGDALDYYVGDFDADDEAFLAEVIQCTATPYNGNRKEECVL